jgi:3-oxoacyl-[acyl-carrier-protein] synthase II
MSGPPRRVAITGLGCITPIGTGIERLREGLRAERSAVRTVDRFDASPFRTRIAAAVDDFDPADYMERSRVKRLDRFAQFSVGASRMALDDAGLRPDALPPERVTVQMGSALGGVAYAEDQLPRYLERGVRGVDPLLALSVFGGSASCNIAIEFGFTGENATNGMSCASGAIAIGEGWRRIRSGEADAAIVGGAEAPLAPLCFGSFAIIRAMSTRNDDPGTASRPFDVGRDGFVMAEGAAVLVLEEMEAAMARGASIYAELAGYGSTNDAHHMTAPRPDGREAARAMRSALTTAGMTPAEVDYVNAHGSSTPLNDGTESAVVRSVLGDSTDAALVSGTKGYHGHALGATGAIEAAITALAMREGWIPPTLNLEEPGEGCDLTYVGPGGAQRAPRAALSNSFGFGGINAVLAFRRHGAATEPPRD